MLACLHRWLTCEPSSTLRPQSSCGPAGTIQKLRNLLRKLEVLSLVLQPSSNALRTGPPAYAKASAGKPPNGRGASFTGQSPRGVGGSAPGPSQ